MSQQQSDGPSAPAEFLTPTEAARLLMVSPVTLRQWAQKGQVPAETTAGGHRRFRREDLEAFAEARGIRLASSAPDRGPTLLIVDDDRQLNGFLTALFSTRIPGIEIRNAYDGFEAGRLVAQFKPAVVLLDFMMPGLDGVQVCESLKASPLTTDIRVVGMTGHYTPELEERLLKAGAVTLLKKPFEAAEVLAASALMPASDLQGSTHGTADSTAQKAPQDWARR